MTWLQTLSAEVRRGFGGLGFLPSLTWQFLALTGKAPQVCLSCFAEILSHQVVERVSFVSKSPRYTFQKNVFAPEEIC